MKVYSRPSHSFLVVLLMTVLTGGCGKETSPGVSSPPSSYAVAFASQTSSSSQDIDLDTYADLTQAFHRRARTAPTWREAQRQVEAHLRYTRVTSLPRSLREAGAAEAMLTHHFRERMENPSTEELEVISLHVNRLLQVRATASPLFVPAFHTLRGHWPDTRLAAAVDTVLEATREQYVVDPKGVDPHIPDVHSEVRKAYRTLERFRESLRTG